MSIAPETIAKLLAKLPGAPPTVAVEGTTVTLTYASLAAYSARTSADVEALRKLAPIAEAAASAVPGAAPSLAPQRVTLRF